MGLEEFQRKVSKDNVMKLFVFFENVWQIYLKFICIVSFWKRFFWKTYPLETKKVRKRNSQRLESQNLRWCHQAQAESREKFPTAHLQLHRFENFSKWKLLPGLPRNGGSGLGPVFGNGHHLKICQKVCQKIYLKKTFGKVFHVFVMKKYVKGKTLLEFFRIWTRPKSWEVLKGWDSRRARLGTFQRIFQRDMFIWKIYLDLFFWICFKLFLLENVFGKPPLFENFSFYVSFASACGLGPGTVRK